MNVKPDVCLLSFLKSVKDSHTRHLLRILPRHGYVPMTICPDALDAEFRSLGLNHCELARVEYHFWAQGTPVVHVFKACWQRCVNAGRAIRHLARHKPRMVLCMEPDSWLVAVILKPLFGHAVVVDLRELYEDRLIALPRWVRPALRPLLRGAMWMLSLFTDEILHVSEERQREYAYLAKPGVVVVNYPDASAFAGAGEGRPPLPEGIIALHAGALRNSYAANELLAAVRLARAEIPELRLVVLGGKSQKLQSDDLLDAMIAEGGVSLIGNVPTSAVVRYLMAADIGISLVLPVDRTHVLAQPRKLYEYLLAGLPVIGADVPTIRRVLQESDCGLVVDPRDPRKIADALVTLAKDRDLRRRLGRNGRAVAETRYNWSTQEERFLNVCLRFAGAASQPPAPGASRSQA